MSNWFSKQISSFAFWLQKTYERIITSKPSLFLVGIATMAFAFFLLSGGIYSIMNPDPNIPAAGIFAGDRIYVFYPSLNVQFTFIETLLVMIFGAIGVAGFLTAYRSVKYAYNPRQAYLLLLVGCLLLLIGYILIERGLLLKFGLA
jgi:hypothetical protein